MQEYFLYRHIRHDKNEIFYIGIGATHPKSKAFQKKHARAFNFISRTRAWKNIIAKTTWEVEIMLYSSDLNFICQKEQEFIALYKRKQDGGTLINFSLGGDSGSFGVKRSQETLSKMSLNNFWKNKTGKDNPFSKAVFVYNLDGQFLQQYGGIREAARSLNVIHTGISAATRSKRHVWYNYMFFVTYQGENIEPASNRYKHKRLYMFNLEKKLLQSFQSAKEACEILGYKYIINLRYAASRNAKYKKHFWSYSPSL